MDVKTLGSGHLKVANDLKLIALTSTALGLREAATVLFEQVLKIQEKALGPDDLEVAGTLDVLSLLYRAQGRDNDAVTVETRSKAIHAKHGE